MRAFLAVVMGLCASVLLALCLPVAWAQTHLVDRGGYEGLAQRAAADPDLQAATARELAGQVERLGNGVDPDAVTRIAAFYTASSTFPGQFARANGFAHGWLFTDTFASRVDRQGRWVIDVAPMLADPAFSQTLRDYNLTLPSSLPVPLTDNAPTALRPGAWKSFARWGPWVEATLAGLTTTAVLLTLVVAKRRGHALAALGLAAMVVAASGWAAIELAQPRLRHALDDTSGNTRGIAAPMLKTAEDSMHHWLNVTLIIGGSLVVAGVLASLVGGMRRGA